MATSITVEKNVVIAMRDGTVTRANVYRPGAAGHVPAILVRTPYGKDMLAGQNTALDPLRAVESGLAVVCQDVRGRYESEGDLTMFEEADDGYDSVEWVANQPWCDGNVGMTGSSYLGAVQWLAAARRPPSLRTIVPVNIGAPPYMESLCFTGSGGAFKLGYVLWLATALFGPETARRRALAGEIDAGEVLRLLKAGDDVESLARWRPLSTLPVLKENAIADWYFDVLRHDGSKGGDVESLRAHYGAIEVPVLNVGGWYDYFLGGTLQNFAGVQAHSGSDTARRQQRLLIGPWDHALNARTAEYDFGFAASPAAMDFTGYQLDHFARHLKGSGQAAEDLPRVRIFVMGENVWRDEDSWPPARSTPRTWYFHSGALPGYPGGILSPEKPSADDLPDHYLYDPSRPAPTLGGPVGLPGLAQGINVGPYDQRPLEARPDVLVFTSKSLRQPVEVTGPVTAVLYAATSGPDTDWIVRLCDVHPDGASRILAEGVVRARHRNGARHPSAVEPGAVERYEIDLVATSNVFMEGHRIRVSVTSSSFPYLEPNPNTCHPLGEDGALDLRPALQTVFHDASRASGIVLPVVPR